MNLTVELLNCSVHLQSSHCVQ